MMGTKRDKVWWRSYYKKHKARINENRRKRRFKNFHDVQYFDISKEDKKTFDNILRSPDIEYDEDRTNMNALVAIIIILLISIFVFSTILILRLGGIF